MGSSTTAGSSTSVTKASSREMDRIPKLIANQRWRSLKSLLSSDRFLDQVSSSFADRNDAQESLLHYCCRFHPPINVVMKLYELCPKVLCEANKSGKFPLHLACKYCTVRPPKSSSSCWKKARALRPCKIETAQRLSISLVSSTWNTLSECWTRRTHNLWMKQLSACFFSCALVVHVLCCLKIHGTALLSR